MITQERVRELFDYADGVLYWRELGRNRSKDGAGTSLPNGERQIKIDGKFYYVHKLIYLWHHGTIPKIVGHRNNDRTDNRIENLVETTKSVVMARRPLKRSKSPYRGISWTGSSWRASLTHEGQWYYLGSYIDPIDAARAYDEAAIRFRGEMARTNF